MGYRPICQYDAICVRGSAEHLECVPLIFSMEALSTRSSLLNYVTVTMLNMLDPQRFLV